MSNRYLSLSGTAWNAPAPRRTDPSQRIAAWALGVSLAALPFAIAPFVDTPVWALAMALAILAIRRLGKGRPGRRLAIAGLGISIVAAIAGLFMSTLVLVLVVTHKQRPCQPPGLGAFQAAPVYSNCGVGR